MREVAKRHAYMGLQYSIVLSYVCWVHFSLLFEYALRCIKPSQVHVQDDGLKVRCAICLDDISQREMNVSSAPVVEDDSINFDSFADIVDESSASRRSGLGEGYERSPIFCPLCSPIPAPATNASTTCNDNHNQNHPSPFCSHCLAPYHCGSSCDYYAARERAWRDWRAGEGGQQGVLELLVMQGVMTKAEVEREKDKLKDILSVQRMTLHMDEEYKVVNCRHCPRCHRLVEHMGGCDLMRCGQDYHATVGGDRVGCGETFRFSAAKPYTPASTNPRKDKPQNKADADRTWVDWWWGEGWKEEMERKKKVKMYSQTHALSADLGVHLCCDGCKLKIKGPLLRCLNCPTVDLCLICGVRGDGGSRRSNDREKMEEWSWTGLSRELLWGDGSMKRKKARKLSSKPDGYLPKHLPSHVCLVILPQMD
eukprot:gene28867-34840_t